MSRLYRLARRRVGGRDEGATLIYALLFITVVAVTVTAIVSLTGNLVRTTVTQRDQAATTAAVEGAAQIAINTLRRSSYSGGNNNCFGSSDKVAFNSFFRLPSTGNQGSVIIQCYWVFQLPDDAPRNGERTWIYMDVYACPYSTTCTVSTGRLSLRFKVTMLDPSGSYVAGRRQVEVYAWSVQR